MWIPDCRSIHTFFMQFPIDVVFVRDGRVAALRESLQPFRLAGVPGKPADVVELVPSSIAASGTRTGDPLLWEAD